ncbi:MAG TPA: hypothetical protein VLD17_10465 [Gemmatimonadaceae bacterium]|nr:hypothetical protein [Gemmatimonadaceae bacterium]
MRQLALLATPLVALSMRGTPAFAQRMHMGSDTSGHDSAFAARQARGKMVMGVDQSTSTHHFVDLPNGGRITLVRDSDDAAGAARIQHHLREIAAAFSSGDFSSPMLVHMRDVPGTRVMAEKKALIHYSTRALDRGGELTIQSADPDAVRAIHEFLAFQRTEHHVPPT